jgi:uncharacterized phage protein (TIGR02218 family)
MKTASTALKAHLQQGQTTLAYLWKVKRVDGTLLGFTNHDVNIGPYLDADGDTVTYLASTGFVPFASQNKSDLSVDNLEVTGFLESESLQESDLRAGRYDDALIEERFVNWADLTMGDVLLRSGTLGIVKMSNGMFHAELRGRAYKLTTVIGSLYGPTCRAQFGSGLNGIDLNSQWLCMIDVTLWRQAGSVASVTNSRIVVPNSGLKMVGSSTPTNPAPADWFDNGIITFTSGVNDGISFEIREWDGTRLLLYLPMPSLPAASDTFTIEPGCDHTPTDCQQKFVNIDNFRGENFMPGNDTILQYGNIA